MRPRQAEGRPESTTRRGCAARAATLALCCALASDCADETRVDATSTPAAAESGRVVPTQTKAPDGSVIETTPNSAAPLPPPLIERRAGLWLVDLPSSRVHALHDVAIGANFEYWGSTRFVADGTLWVEPFDSARPPEHFSPDGARLVVAPGERPPSSGADCNQPDPRVEQVLIEGRAYAATAECSRLTPA